MIYKAKIKLYGELFEINIENDDPILIVALSQGFSPPFSCQVGTCSTCRAKLIEGKVRMDEDEGLTNEEIEQGYILTCQSHPETEFVFVDYDE
jgi:ring-1,2-phenylacetyl-CoA epoxidase subunit PaaE